MINHFKQNRTFICISGLLKWRGRAAKVVAGKIGIWFEIRAKTVVGWNDNVARSVEELSF